MAKYAAVFAVLMLCACDADIEAKRNVFASNCVRWSNSPNECVDAANRLYPIKENAHDQ